MGDNKRKPDIRFQGFTDDWEQRKLSECAGFRRGSFPQPYGNKEWYDGEGAMPFVQGVVTLPLFAKGLFLKSKTSKESSV